MKTLDFLEETSFTIDGKSVAVVLNKKATTTAPGYIKNEYEVTLQIDKGNRISVLLVQFDR